MSGTETSYNSYLLRLWRSDAPGGGCRAMLEEIRQPGQRHYFQDVESLAVFLLQLVEELPVPKEEDVDGEG